MANPTPIRRRFSHMQMQAITISTMPTFGGVAVCEVPDLNGLMLYAAKTGYEHHVALCQAKCADVLEEALGNYMGWDVYRHS